MIQAPDIRIDGLSFDGFDQGFADRAAAVFQTALLEGSQGITLSGQREIQSLDLDSLDFSTADSLGQSLANAILAELVK